MIEGIIFDKDGVIFDTEPAYAMANVGALERFGIPLTEEEYYDFWTREGKGLPDFLRSRDSGVDIEQVRAERQALLDPILEASDHLIEGAMETIKALYNHYPLAMVTSSSEHVTRLQVRKSRLTNYFRTIITADDVRMTKPHPEGFLLAANHLGIEPARMLVIEDAEKGIIAARRAGMKIIAIPTRYTAGNDFSFADAVIESIHDLTYDLVRRL